MSFELHKSGIVAHYISHSIAEKSQQNITLSFESLLVCPTL